MMRMCWETVPSILDGTWKLQPVVKALARTTV